MADRVHPESLGHSDIRHCDTLARPRPTVWGGDNVSRAWTCQTLGDHIRALNSVEPFCSHTLWTSAPATRLSSSSSRHIAAFQPRPVDLRRCTRSQSREAGRVHYTAAVLDSYHQPFSAVMCDLSTKHNLSTTLCMNRRNCVKTFRPMTWPDPVVFDLMTRPSCWWPDPVVFDLMARPSCWTFSKSRVPNYV